MFPECELPGFLIERPLPAGVKAAWDAMVAVIGADLVEVGGEHSFSLDQWPLVERTTEIDAPRRRVYEIVSGAPVRRYEGTTTFEPGPGGSARAVLRWEVVIEPADEPYDAFLARAEVAVTRGVDFIAQHCSRGAIS